MRGILGFALRKNSARRPLFSLVLLVGVLVMAMAMSSAQAPPLVRTSGDAVPTLHWSVWPEWDLHSLPERGRFSGSTWMMIPRDVGGEVDRAWQCELGAREHIGGPRSQALAASLLQQPAGDLEGLDGRFKAAQDADLADLVRLNRDQQKAGWLAQLAPLTDMVAGPPSFGLPSDDLLWHHISFDWIDEMVPMAGDQTAARVHDLIAATVSTDPFLQAYADYVDQFVVANGGPPGMGVQALPEFLKAVSADDARRFLQYGGFPKVAPVAGTPEFRIEVESIKARWASCDITNPPDPYHVLSEAVATAEAEWAAERGALAADRKAIVDANIDGWTRTRLANDAMAESAGQAWVAERALAWQRSRISAGRPLTAAEQATLNAVIKDAQNRISAQILTANKQIAIAVTDSKKADTAQAAATAKATAAGYPPGRGLTYARQSVQVTKALALAARATAAAANTALQSTKATGDDSAALWAQTQAEMYAVQASFRRQAAEYAQYEAQVAAGLAAAEAQKAADMAARAHDDRVQAEAAEAAAKVKAQDAHAKMLAAKAERDNAAAKRAEVDRQRDKAAADKTRAEQQRDIATSKRNQALAQADAAARKRQDAEQAERYATDQRNIAINAAIAGNTLQQQAAAAEAYADADDSQDDAADARAAATQARAAANAATSAAGRAQAAADNATAAAVAARKAATEAKAAADRADAAAGAAEADAAATAAQLRTAQAAAADAIDASEQAATAVQAAQQQAAIAAAKAQEARDQAAQAREQANLSLGASADAFGRATAAADQATATRDAALRTYAAADDAVAMGTPFAQTDTSAGMAVLVGMDAKTVAEQQSAAADAKAADAARAAQAAHDAAVHADADAKAAADAAAVAADAAVAAQNSVKAAAASAKQAAQEAFLAAASVARTAQYNADAQADAAAAARYAAEAHSEAQAAWDAADEAERDAAAAHVAADQASAAAADARRAAEQAEKDADAAEAAAQRALQDAQAAQNAAALAEKNADAQARDALAVSSPAGEAGVQPIPHVQPQVISQTPIVCPPLSGSRFCETEVTFRMVGTMDLVLVTCPDLSQTSCPGQENKDLLSTVAINDPPQTRTVQLDRSDVLDILGHVVTSLISDYITCFKGVTVNDGKIDGSQAKDWAIACAWVLSDWVLPLVVTKVGRAIKAMRIAMRTGVGFGEAYEALRSSGISAAAITKIESEMYEAVIRLCGGHSFAADTPVALAGGGTKPISQMAVGDLVRATDPLSGRTHAEPVTRQFATQDTELTDVTVRNADGGTSIVHTTPHHPFWAGDWVDAADLDKGDQLTGGVTVESVRTYPGTATMYDLTVDELHTYYVEAAGADVLVHNVNCPIWVTRALEALKSKRITTGQMFDDSGNPLFVEISSGRDSSTALIDDFLAKSPDISGGPYSASKDTEAKFAWWMRLYGGQRKVDVVINHPKGPCASCRLLVPAILKPGQEMHVWYPNAVEPVKLVGRSTVP